MLQRTSYINNIDIKVVSFASIIQLGDSRIINGLSRALAVQREVETFNGNEGNFAAYPTFFESIPLLPITEEISYHAHNLTPLIKVNKVYVLAFSASAIMHVGNSENVYMEARVKHTRQLQAPNGEQV